MNQLRGPPSTHLPRRIVYLPMRTVVFCLSEACGVHQPSDDGEQNAGGSRRVRSAKSRASALWRYPLCKLTSIASSFVSPGTPHVSGFMPQASTLRYDIFASSSRWLGRAGLLWSSCNTPLDMLCKSSETSSQCGSSFPCFLDHSTFPLVLRPTHDTPLATALNTLQPFTRRLLRCQGHGLTYPSTASRHPTRSRRRNVTASRDITTNAQGPQPASTVPKLAEPADRLFQRTGHISAPIVGKFCCAGSANPPIGFTALSAWALEARPLSALPPPEQPSSYFCRKCGWHVLRLTACRPSGST